MKVRLSRLAMAVCCCTMFSQISYAKAPEGKFVESSPRSAFFRFENDFFASIENRPNSNAVQVEFEIESLAEFYRIKISEDQSFLNVDPASIGVAIYKYYGKSPFISLGNLNNSNYYQTNLANFVEGEKILLTIFKIDNKYFLKFKNTSLKNDIYFEVESSDTAASLQIIAYGITANISIKYGNFSVD